MKKIFGKFTVMSLCMIFANAVFSIAVSAAGSASYWGAYQPKEPQILRNLTK